MNECLTTPVHTIPLGVGAELLTCPYPLKIQARPPRNQRPAIRCKVSGRGGGGAVPLTPGAFNTHLCGSHLVVLWRKEVGLSDQSLAVTSRVGHRFTCSALTGRKEGNVLFNDALNTFYLRLYGVKHMLKDNTDSERGNPLPPHGLLFSISSKGSFICIIPDRITHTTAFVTPVVEHWLVREIGE